MKREKVASRGDEWHVHGLHRRVLLVVKGLAYLDADTAPDKEGLHGHGLQRHRLWDVGLPPYGPPLKQVACWGGEWAGMEDHQTFACAKRESRERPESREQREREQERGEDGPPQRHMVATVRCCCLFSRFQISFPFSEKLFLTTKKIRRK